MINPNEAPEGCVAVVPNISCKGCYFLGAYPQDPCRAGACSKSVREDKCHVIFIKKPVVSPTGIEKQVCDDIAERQQKGIAKYGTTVAENPLTHKQWLQHAYEEALDMAIYLKRAMQNVV